MCNFVRCDLTHFAGLHSHQQSMRVHFSSIAFTTKCMSYFLIVQARIFIVAHAGITVEVGSLILDTFWRQN